MATTYTIEYDKLEHSIIIPVLIEYNNCVVSCNALVDTGATNCAISDWVAKDLQLPMIEGAVSCLLSADNKSIRPIVRGNIFISSDLSFNNWKITSIKNPCTEYDVIIGTDILSRCDYTISNYNNHTVFSLRYPSQGEVKYGPATDHNADINNLADRFEDRLLST